MTSIDLSIINLRTNKENALATSQIYINKNPDFQRDYEAWDDKLKTRFIETILLGRAMNPIWTIDNPEDKCEDVLDGMHRLTTALDYLNDKFKLNFKHFSNIKDESYDKKMFKDLDSTDQSKIRQYKFMFNILDESYHYDVNLRRDMYEILNRSSKTLNDYEFLKVIYNPYFYLISNVKKQFISIFFSSLKDKRGKIETEIIDILLLSQDVPNYWSSVSQLRKNYFEKNLGHTQESVNLYLEQNKDYIEDDLNMIIKIILKLKDNKFFADDKRRFNTCYLPYKFIISRLLFHFKDISLFNRHIIDIIPSLRENITEINIQQELDCKTRNATFQKKLIKKIDDLINTSIEKNKDRRLFSKEEIEQKLLEQGNVCANCKQSKETYEGDHIIEWSKGGRTIYENLQVLCKDCHHKKTGRR